MKFKAVHFWVFFNFWVVPNLFGQTFTQADSIRGAYHELRSCFDLTHYRLKIKLDPVTRYISGTNTISFQALSAMKKMQLDLDPNFDILKLVSPLGKVQWSREGNAILISLPSKLEQSQNSWIQIHFAGHPHVAANPPWDGGFVWHHDQEGNPWVGVACEGSGSSLWFPSKDHPRDEPDSVLLQFEVPKNLVAVSNGQLVEKKAITDSTVQYAYRVTYPINHYNISLNVAPYVSWTDTMRLSESGSVLKLKYHVLPGFEEKGRVQFKQAKTVIRVLSQLFGDYPFERDGYQLVQTPYLGMEHQSCIAYGSQFKDNAFGFDFILMHETGHEWWGNRTSANDHADMWIHESFCTYAEALYIEKMQDEATSIKYLLEQKKKIKNKTPVQGPRDVYYNDWKDSDMYYKGTWMLHSLRHVIQNDSLWFQWLHSFGFKFGFSPISGDQVIHYANQFFGQNFSPFFHQYLLNQDWPILKWRWSKTNQKLEYRWQCNEKEFSYPVSIFLDGRETRLQPDGEWKSLPLEKKPGKVELAEGKFLAEIKEER